MTEQRVCAECCKQVSTQHHYVCMQCDHVLLCENCEVGHDKKHSRLKVYFQLKRDISIQCDPFLSDSSVDGSLVNIHKYIVCNVCSCVMGDGVRYCCLNCDNFNICSSCESQAIPLNLHPIDHCFMKLRSTVLSHSMIPFLSDSVYDTATIKNYQPKKKKRSKVTSYSTSSDYLVRQTEYEDLDMILAIEQECFREISFTRKYFEKIISQKDSPSPKYICYSIVEKSSEQLVGHCSCKRLDQKGRIVGIDTIAICRIFQGYGLGRKLLSFVIEQLRLRSFWNIVLNVNVNNLIAQRLYSKLGFVTVEWIDNYYENENADALTMELNLSSEDHEGSDVFSI